MKPFDLEEAKAGKPVILKDGTQLCYLTDKFDSSDYPLMWGIISPSNGCIVHTFTSSIDGHTNKNCDPNLFMAPVKKTAWINVYPGSLGLGYANIYETVEDANKMADKSRITCIQIEWEE